MTGHLFTDPSIAGDVPISRSGRIFDELAPGYDRGNRLISLGGDLRWKRRAAAHLPNGGLLLDLGAGTGDLARILAARGDGATRVVAVDASARMMRHGRWDGAEPLVGDAARLPLGDTCADGAVTGFLLRNLPDLPAFFAEAARVLRPGAPLVLLEIAYPAGALRRRLFSAYFHGLVPLLGGLVTGRWAAYRYLSRSLHGFPSPQDLAAMAGRAGLDPVGIRQGRWSGLFLVVLRRNAGRAGTGLPTAAEL